MPSGSHAPGSSSLLLNAPGMTSMVMPRTETMPAYTHIELDEVHTPSRYFALLSFLSWEVHCAFTAFGFFLLRFTPCLFLSCLSTQQNNRPPAASSEASLDRLATPQDAEDCHRWTRLKDDAPWMLHAPPEKPDFARTLESQENARSWTAPA